MNWVNDLNQLWQGNQFRETYVKFRSRISTRVFFELQRYVTRIFNVLLPWAKIKELTELRFYKDHKNTSQGLKCFKQPGDGGRIPKYLNPSLDKTFKHPLLIFLNIFRTFFDFCVRKSLLTEMKNLSKNNIHAFFISTSKLKSRLAGA